MLLFPHGQAISGSSIAPGRREPIVTTIYGTGPGCSLSSKSGILVKQLKSNGCPSLWYNLVLPLYMVLWLAMIKGGHS